MADQLPGQGFMGWLGRQIGHVKQAVKAKPGPAAQQALPQGGRPAATPAAANPPVHPQAAAGEAKPGPAAGVIVPQVVYREEKVEEVELPDRPGVVLRRTVIDEAIVDPQKSRPRDEG